MTDRRWLLAILAIATLHGAFYIWYQQPDWRTQWTDQDGYRRLGLVLAETGRFTRYPDAPRFVPEVIRTPAYPAFVAVTYRLFGVHQVSVAVAQLAAFLAICLLTYAIAFRASSDRAVARAAGMATALFAPIPYFVALVMTEVLTTLFFTASMWLALQVLDERRTARFAWLGVMLALATLTRPVFVLFPAALAAVGVVVLPVARVERRPRPMQWATMLAAFAVAMMPWFMYNYVTLGRMTLSPAGGVGRGLWEGSWQAKWPGRLQSELTHLADTIDNRAELDRRVRQVADREGLPAEPMLAYVHQWEDIRRIWTEPVDPYARAVARVAADEEYRRVAIENLKRDPASQLLKRIARGVFILWAGEIPIRYSDINRVAPVVIRAIWAVQATLVALAVVGVAALVRRGRRAAAAVLAAPIVYVTAVHFPLLTEARQSLPAQPIVLALAAIGAASLLRRGVICPRTASS